MRVIYQLWNKTAEIQLLQHVFYCKCDHAWLFWFTSEWNAGTVEPWPPINVASEIDILPNTAKIYLHLAVGGGSF